MEQSCGDSEFWLTTRDFICSFIAGSKGSQWHFCSLGFETESSTRSSEAAPWWKVRVRAGTAASCQDASGWSWDGGRSSERQQTILQYRLYRLYTLPYIHVCLSCVCVCMWVMCISSDVNAAWISSPTKCKLAVYVYGSFFMGKCSGNTTFSTSITRRCTNLRLCSLPIVGMLQLQKHLPWIPHMSVLRTWIESFAWFCLS